MKTSVTVNQRLIHLESRVAALERSSASESQLRASGTITQRVKSLVRCFCQENCITPRRLIGHNRGGRSERTARIASLRHELYYLIKKSYGLSSLAVSELLGAKPCIIDYGCANIIGLMQVYPSIRSEIDYWTAKINETLKASSNGHSH